MSPASPGSHRSIVISRALTLLLAGALTLAACGGDETTNASSADDGPSLEEDTAAIEQLVVEFGASVGKEACDFYSNDFLESLAASKAAAKMRPTSRRQRSELRT